VSLRADPSATNPSVPHIIITSIATSASVMRNMCGELGQVHISGLLISYHRLTLLHRGIMGALVVTLAKDTTMSLGSAWISSNAGSPLSSKCGRT
jgi:hypothetical protein